MVQTNNDNNDSIIHRHYSEEMYVKKFDMKSNEEEVDRDKYEENEILRLHDLNQTFPTTISKVVSSTSTRSETKKPIVLVVDDVASNRKMLSRLLMYRCEYFVDAVDGQDAVNKVREAMLKEELFDVITIDHQMPVMDGPTATRRIREMGFTGIIIGLTGNVLPEDIDLFVAAGVNKVLTKPLSAKQFDDTISEYSYLFNSRSYPNSIRRK